VITDQPSRAAGRRDALPRRETAFLTLVASAAAADVERTRRLGTALVGSADLHARFRSRLNNDGSPLQACVSMRRSRPASWRLIGDPFSDRTDAVARLTRTRRRAVALLARQADEAFAGIVRGAVHAAIPPAASSGGAADRLARGSMWIGVPLLGRGAAVYVTGRLFDPPVAWSRVAAWLRALNGSSVVERIQAVAGDRAALASIGIEGADAATAQIKLYFRLSAPLHLGALIAPAQRDILATFADCMAGDARLARHGILIALGVSAGSGDVTDVKLDLCGHCLALDPGSFARAISAVETAFGLPADTCHAMQVGRQSEVAFVGCGIGVTGDPRLNVYFKAHDARLA
jgi:hypothetical protein